MAASSAPIFTLCDEFIALASGLNFDNPKIEIAAIDVQINERVTLDNAVSVTAYLAHIFDIPIRLSEHRD
jgi:hypothetical protein